MTAAQPDPPVVGGEREAVSLDRRPTLRARLGSVLALALMSTLGLGLLTWYYAATLTRPDRNRRQLQAAAAQRAGGEAALPSLGHIDKPLPPPLAVLTQAAESQLAPPPSPLNPVLLPELPVSATPPLSPAAAAPKTAAQSARERRLSGAAFVAVGSGGVPAAAGQAEPRSETPATSAEGGRGQLGGWLQAATTPEVRAQRLPTRRLLLPKGAFIDCTLETAIDSTLPGMTTCVTAADVFGVDGTVVLLERGTKLIGETRGEVQQGAARVFVLWSEARTPTGVVVALASPGADELGRAGLPGEVNRHFWQRFGAAMLVSVIDGAVQAAVQSSASSGGAVIVDPSVSQDVLTDILRSTVNIPPTVLKRNGDRIQVLVARDLDFRSVYALRPAGGGA